MSRAAIIAATLLAAVGVAASYVGFQVGYDLGRMPRQIIINIQRSEK